MGPMLVANSRIMHRVTGTDLNMGMTSRVYGEGWYDAPQRFEEEVLRVGV